MEMDPIWQTLPADLVDRICNMLPRVRAIPVELKNEITSQMHKLMDFYRIARPLYRDHAWVFTYNCLVVHSGKEIPLDDHWNPHIDTLSLWLILTPEEREGF
jgi:hypothetical protein